MEIVTSLPRADNVFVFASPTDNGKSVTGFTSGKQRVLDHRTVTTGMARLGVARHIADKILNHTAGSIRGVAAVYNRFSYLQERRDALNQWGQFVARLVGKNIVAMGLSDPRIGGARRG
jgi:hypothetical protein